MSVSFVLATLLSAFFIPRLYAFLLASIAALISPLIPLALGILCDTLYYYPQAYPFPLYTVLGACISLLAFLLRRFVETSIIRR